MIKKIFIFFLIIIFGFIGIKFYSNMQKVDKLEGKINSLNTKIEKAKEKNDKLEKQLKNIDDMEYVEKMARKKLGLVKKGEILLVPVKEDKNQEDKTKQN